MNGPAQLLDHVTRVEPHQFNSFYRRTLVVRGRPEPLPATVFVEITHRCPLSCAFCMAADTRGGSHVPAARVMALLDALNGVPRIALLGGEPTWHPQFSAIVRRALSVAGEVEVFTNGLPFLKGGPPLEDPRLIWTLAADRYHQDEVGPERFGRLIASALDRRTDGTRIRFNLTGPELHTVGYIDGDTVRGVADALSPRLAERFDDALREGTAARDFYFNPVLCAGSATGMHEGEHPYLEDALRPSELVYAGDEGAWTLLGDLPALWATQRPSHALLGRWTEEDPPGDLAAPFLARALDLEPQPPEYQERIAAASPGDAERLIQGLPTWRALAVDPPGTYDDGLSERLAALAGAPGRAEVRRRNQFTPVSDGTLRALNSRLATHDEGTRERTIGRLADRLLDLFRAGDSPGFPYATGQRSVYGRTLYEDPADLAPLGGRTGDEPGIRFFVEGGVPDLEWERIQILPVEGAPSVPRRRKAVAAALRTLIKVIPAELLRAAKDRAAALAPRPLGTTLQEADLPAPPPRDDDDAMAVFGRVSFHRGRNDGLYDNAPLAAALAAADLTGQGWKNVDKLHQRLGIRAPR